MRNQPNSRGPLEPIHIATGVVGPPLIQNQEVGPGTSRIGRIELGKVRGDMMAYKRA